MKIQSIICCLVLAVASTTVYAQADRRPPRKADRRAEGERLERMFDKLSESIELSEEQQLALDKIEAEQVEKAVALRQNARRNREQARALARETRDRIQEVLTTEQREELKSQMAERRESRRARRGERLERDAPRQ